MKKQITKKNEHLQSFSNIKISNKMLKKFNQIKFVLFSQSSQYNWSSIIKNYIEEKGKKRV